MERSEFWLAFKATFGSVWSWLGIFLGAMSLINLGVAYFELGIGPVVEQMIATYRQIIHPIFDWLFFWIDWKPPEWLADSYVLCIIIGATMGRAGALVPRYSVRGARGGRMMVLGHLECRMEGMDGECINGDHYT